MNRSSTRTVADYQGNALARATIVTADDSQLQQEVTLQLLTGEAQQTIEHWLPYGFGHVPLPPSGNPTVAETIVGFLIGRSHGIAFPTIDRRYRLGNMQPGDVAHFDHQGHQVHIASTGNAKPPGVYHSAPNDKLHQTRVMKETADSVFGKLVQLADFSGNYGQAPWLPHPIHSYKHHDANVHQHQHPDTINHQIISGDAIPPNAGALGNIATQITGAISQVTNILGAGSPLAAVVGIASQISGLASQVAGTVGATTAMTGVASQVMQAASALITAPDLPTAALAVSRLRAQATILAAHIAAPVNIATAAVTIGAAADQIAALATVNGTLPSLNVIAGQVVTVAASLGGLIGATSQVTSIAGQIGTVAAAIAAATSMTGLPGMASQLQGLVGQLSGMTSISGLMSQIIHAHSLDQIKGILHSAFQGQHTTTHNTQGIRSTSTFAVVDTARNIAHDGPTWVNDVLTVADITNSPIYTNASDRRLKTRIVEHPSILDKITALKVVAFDEHHVWRDHDGKPIVDKTRTRPMVGFIAQDVREILPGVVFGDEANDFLSVSENKIGVLLVKAFQEFVVESRAENAASRAEIEALKARVQKLEEAHFG